MKKLLTFIAFVCALLPAAAQQGLQIDALFGGKYADTPGATEIVLSGSKLSPYHLTDYHSLTLTDMPDEAGKIERMVRADARTATDREVTYRDGGIYYAFYELPTRGKTRSYIVFLNRHRGGGNTVTLVYMAGKATAEQIKSFMKSNTQASK